MIAKRKKGIAILADMPRHAVGRLATGRGGGQAATWLSQTAECYAGKIDFDVSWLTLDPEVNRVEMDEALGQRFYRIPRGKMTWDIAFRHWFAKRKLLGVIRELQPDLVHLWGTESSYPSVLEAVNLPSILSMQGVLTELRRLRVLPDCWRMRRQSSYEPTWLGMASIITTESKWAMERVKRIVPTAEVRIVEYGVNPTFFDVPWQPAFDDPYFVFCGAVCWGKGIDVLAAAMEIEPAPKWRCCVAGDGDLRSALQSRGIPGLEFSGLLTWSELQCLLSRAWALVHPTRADSSPNAVKEARAIGLPVITTVHGGQAEYIHHEVNGLIANPLTPANLREALDRIASDFHFARQLGENRLQEDRAHLSPERTATEFISIYDDVLG